MMSAFFGLMLYPGVKQAMPMLSKLPASSGRMGLASPAARVGDYVLLVQGIERTVIVRRTISGLKIVGTAILAANYKRGRASRELQMKKESKFGTADFSFHLINDAVDMVLDVGIAYHLLLA
jgi:hypothetical protein